MPAGLATLVAQAQDDPVDRSAVRAVCLPIKHTRRRWAPGSRALLLAWGLGAHPVSASPGPISACTAPSWPIASLEAAPPTIGEWSSKAWPAGVIVPACLGWDTHRFNSFAAVVGTFSGAAIEDVLRRVGAISAYSGLRYWSVTDRRLEPLITEAFAVDDAQGKVPRPDFDLPELVEGRNLFFFERDNRLSGPVLYRMQIVERNSTRLVIDIVNLSSAKAFLVNMFAPGDLRTALFISQAQDGTWSCYVLSGFHSGSFAGLFENHKSHINRILSLYSRVAAAEASDLPWQK